MCIEFFYLKGIVIHTTDKKEKQNRQVICNMFGQENSFLFLNTKLQISNLLVQKRKSPAHSVSESWTILVIVKQRKSLFYKYCA